jgi:hypothetical protein
MVSLTWSQVGTIIGAFVVVKGAFSYHIERRFSDLRSEINHRFDDLKLWVQSEFRRLDERLERLEQPLHK